MARAVAFAVIAVAAGAAGHVLAGGTATWLAITCVAVGMAVGAWGLAGREWHWPGIAALLLVGQLLTHLSLQLPALFSVHPAAHASGAGHWWPTPVMLVVHGLAAGATAAWLRWGERLVWTAARRTAAAAVAALAALRGLLNRYRGLRGVAAHGLRSARWLTPSPPRRRHLRHCVVLRAPPCAA
ncbi:MAG: putative integral rane protein [Pseudonocardia sp.]|nr:putative integral rane protein [Pseudonocardia sp.]